MSEKFEKENKDPHVPENFDDFRYLRAGGHFVECPCCQTRHNQVYKRRIYKSIVKALRSLADKKKDITACSVGDFSKLRYWGLIEYQGSEGSWKVTNDGWSFLDGLLAVPRYVFIQNNNVIGRSNENVFIFDIID